VEGRVDEWESHFREKSARRSRRRAREAAMKRAVLLLLFGSMVAAVWLWFSGLPR
jgi:hypothetical protein